MELVGIHYVHEPLMAPTQDILKGYKNKEMTWKEYEVAYSNLLEKRDILSLAKSLMVGERVCFLCSEEKPDYCHRRLLAEYVQSNAEEEIKIQHLI